MKSIIIESIYSINLIISFIKSDLQSMKVLTFNKILIFFDYNFIIL